MIRLGTRGSALAMAQARLVADALGQDVEIRVVRTRGDASSDALRKMGDGIFAAALEDALRRGEIDLAVHSLKDLPTDERAGLVVAAVPFREDSRDVLVARDRGGLRSLSSGARVGTSSPRREAQLRELRPDLTFADIRGNVETRMAKVMAGEHDATLLALAGLRRLGVAVGDAEILSLDEMLPAPGQGALAAQCREEDADVRARLAAIDDPAVRDATTAERALLRALGGSCEIALGAFARVEDGQIVLDAVLVEGSLVRARERGLDPVALGTRAAARLREPVHAR